MICQRIHAKKGTDTPCSECLPAAYPENRDAVAVYFFCQNQVIFTPAGKPVDMDFKSVEIAVNRLGASNPDDCFQKVIALGRHFIRKNK